ncbi:alpha/beta-hydrolase [Pluteus cervinus]|uniref:Alpha/beta-hydrolase n=1 Tax=Pluteus cervinus TaxID=181527 RepID=A0ACD3AEY4_9AGAR|nr:alpha/beta-hydrolase [Pluteus cervinus]
MTVNSSPLRVLLRCVAISSIFLTATCSITPQNTVHEHGVSALVINDQVRADDHVMWMNSGLDNGESVCSGHAREGKHKNEAGRETAITTLRLNSLDVDAFTVLSHPRFPSHQVRVKKSDFCDPTVNVYTGYLDVDYGAKHLFFYFFESRRSPDTDDVMMWINGGPGCSSSLGLLMELGPCSIDMKNVSSNGTVWNPHSWNQETNIFFLDQPVGVGYSYADFGETVETTEDAAKNIHAFVTIFFETFNQFAGRPFHLSGESYGGRYLPVFASEIWDQNQIATSEGRPAINLKSVIIGNGITDISTLYEGRYEIECGKASFDVPFQSISNCVRMKTALPRCQRLMNENCIQQFDAMNCQAAVSFCDSQLSTAMWDSGRNVYDISKPCIGDLCYAENSVISDYLNSPSLRKSLGVTSPLNHTGCSSTVGRSFASHMDKWNSPTQHYVSELLERGVRVLIYAGTLDWQCNWVANWRWVEKLGWSGNSAWQRVGGRREWSIGETADGVKAPAAGEVKRSKLLSFVTVWGAGHMVPYDKPKEAWYVISKWLKDEEL